MRLTPVAVPTFAAVALAGAPPSARPHDDQACITENEPGAMKGKQ